MKKIFGLLTTLLLLNGCVESMALLGPATTAGSGNVARSAFSSAISYGVKKQTGKSPTEHAMAYVKENNPENKKEKCISFLESTNSKTCAAVKKSILETRKNIVKKSKIKILNIESIYKRY